MDLSLQRKLLQYLNLSTCAIKDFQKSGDFDLFEILDVGSNLQSEILTQTQKDSLPKSNLNKKQPPSLPYEILVKIFHLCCNHTLSNTCLVSKTWFQVSRNQIWSTIELAKEAQSETNAMLLSIAIKSSLAFCKTHSYWPAVHFINLASTTKIYKN